MPKILNLGTQEMQKLLQSKTTDVGAGLYDHTTRIQMNQATRTLIIGVGGTGVKTINSIKRYLENRANNNYKEYISLLAIDADENELSGARYLKPDEKRLISIAATIANENINIEDNRATYVKNWIYPRFHVNFDTNGANRIRQSGRSKLFTGPGVGAIMDTQLRSAITAASGRLAAADAANPRKVILVTGLAGGTGSGTFNDIAMLVKEALGRTTQITGVFYLPDTVDEYAGSAIIRQSLYANGYAALKELDYYFSVTQRSDYNDRYISSDGTSVEIDANHPLYNMTILVSGSKTDEDIIDRNRTATDVIVESLINILAAIPQHDDAGSDQQLISSFLSNAEDARNAVMAAAIMPDGMETANYFLEDIFMYTGLGVATASIPEEACTSHLVNSIIGRMYESIPEQYRNIRLRPVIGKPSFDENNAPTEVRNHFDDDMTKNNYITYESIAGFITEKTRCTTPEDADDSITKAEIQSNSIDSLLATYVVDTRVTVAKGEVKQHIKDLFSKFRIKAIAFMQVYGPQALVDLYDGIGKSGREYVNYKGIHAQLDEALTNAKKPNKLHRKEQELKKEREKKGLIINRFNKAAFLRKFTEWVSAESEVKVWNYALQVSDSGCEIQTGLINPIKEFIDSCRDLAKILSDLNIIYDNFSVSFSTAGAFANAYDNKANINLIDEDNTYQWVKDRLDTIIRKVNINDLVGAIIEDYFTNNPVDWSIIDDNGRMTLRARERFDSLMSQAIKTANNGKNVSITINEYLAHRTAAAGIALPTIIENISHKLENASKPMFKRDAVIPQAPNLQHYIIIPDKIVAEENGAVILQSFYDANPGAKVYTSAETDKITCYSIVSGNPLYSLAHLGTWEQEYEKANGAMIHMNESGKGAFNPKTGLEWKNYPSCRSNFDARQTRLPIDERNQNSEYRFLTTEFDAMFDKALEYGIVRKMGDAAIGYYYNFYDITIPDWNYDTANYVIIDHHQPAPGIPFVDFLFAQNRVAGGGGKRIQLGGRAGILTDARIYDDAALNEAEPLRRAKRVMRRNVKMYIKMKQSVIKYEEIFPQGGPNDDWAADVFIDAVKVGLICKHPTINNIYTIRVGPTPVNLINYNPAYLGRLSTEDQYLLNNNHLYVLLFNSFFTKYGSNTALDDFKNIVTREYDRMDLIDPTGATIQNNMIEYQNEKNIHNAALLNNMLRINVMNALGITDDQYDSLHIDLLYNKI